MSRFRKVVAATALAAALAGCGAGTAAGPAPAAAQQLPPNPPRPAACAVPPSTDLTTTAGWLNRVATAPGSVGLAVDDGRGHVVSHEATTPFPLASAAKVVHLSAYAAAVADGRIRPEEQVALTDWERWYVPGTDGGAHPAAMARLGLPAGGTATVDQLVTAMIRESDNAAADWLRARLGDDALRAAAASGGWTDVDLPSFAGATVRLLEPGAAPAGATRPQLAALDAQLGRRYADDPAFRTEVADRSAAAAADPAAFVVANQRWAPTTASATPTQVLGLYRAIATGAIPGADVAARQLAWQGPVPGVGTVGFKSGSYVDVLSFGSFLRREDGTLGYAAVLGRDLPLVPPVTEQATGQQGLALSALRSEQGLDRLLCVA